MEGRNSEDIRREFFEFFREKGHLLVESAPVVPAGDPTLLFTNAGMNQFKPIFLGEEKGYRKEGKIWKRVVNTQRCIRVSGKHNDLDEVGHDTYHHTLFEMLGNWSFGDYFKKEAISWAWELLTDRWKLDKGRLYVTVFGGNEEDGQPEDTESAGYWESETDIDPSRILRFGSEDNFWEMGDSGPCGPCSEIHIDLRSDEERREVDGATLVNRDHPLVMEIWNLVFIQYNRLADRTLEKLPARHVDTGMGFERICAILQGKTSNYDSDLFQPLLKKISGLSGVKYGEGEETDIAMRVIVDHIRAVSFAIADGASPSNEGRGYVIRRILRRAVRYGWDKLGFREPFFHRLVPVLAEQFRTIFPELERQTDYVTNVVRAEEQSFIRTLGQGIQLFEEMVAGRKHLGGEELFKLHDTYGFPVDLTELMAAERGVTVDRKRFEALMAEQKERGRASDRFSAAGQNGNDWKAVSGNDRFEFTGYDEYETPTRIRALSSQNGKNFILLERSPFYAESGGQVADVGFLEKGEEIIRVLDVQKAGDGYVHRVDRLPENPEGEWLAVIDSSRRIEIEKHHSATHLMHAALRQVLGDHVVQKGSLVEPDRLRFDFSHFSAVTPEELDEIATIVNERIQENIPLLEQRDVPLAVARESGAMMLFGEKYGETVRVITFDPDFSSELCGGTHVGATGEIGYFRFLRETSVAAGIRRVEAVVGMAAHRHLQQEQKQLQQVMEALEGSGDPAGEIRQLISERKRLEKEIESLRKKEASETLSRLLDDGESAGPARYFFGEVAGAGMDLLKQLGYEALEREKNSGVVILGSSDPESGKVVLMAAVTPDLIEKGLKAGDLVRELGKVVGGGGGGQPDLATAGGRFPEKLPEAFARGRELIIGKLGG